MLSKDCQDCKYCAWMVGIGQGVRCTNEENQKYKSKDDKNETMPVSISFVPENCNLHIIDSENEV